MLVHDHHIDNQTDKITVYGSIKAIRFLILYDLIHYQRRINNSRIVRMFLRNPVVTRIPCERVIALHNNHHINPQHNALGMSTFVISDTYALADFVFPIISPFLYLVIHFDTSLFYVVADTLKANRFIPMPDLYRCVINMDDNTMERVLR